MSKSMSSSPSTPASPILLLSYVSDLGTKMDLVLASQSPRRREILDMMGLAGKYTVEPSPLDESKLQEELNAQKLSSKEYTLQLAQAKAQALAEAHVQSSSTALPRPTLYLGSDTIVEIDDCILEKPQDEAQAMKMLRRLSGNEHSVHTGVALYRVSRSSQGPSVSLVSSFVETAQVTFSSLTDGDIQNYVATGEPLDKAGSYGIQGIGGQIVSQLQGDYFCVMGLPMHKTSVLIAQALKDEADQSSES